MYSIINFTLSVLSLPQVLSSSVQSLSRVPLFETPWINCSMPGLPVHHQLPEFTQIHVHRVSDAIQPSCPQLSPSASALNLSHHQGLSNESTLCIRWPKYWNFSFSISPSNECSGLISFRMDWLDLFAVPGTLKGLLQCVPMYMLECSLSGVGLFVTLWTVACQTSLFHGISQARTLERVAISSSRGSTWPRDWTHISCTDRWILYHWAIWEAHYFI